jgi:ribosomal protein L11 methyltransferase
MVGEGLCVGAGRISLEKIPSQEWAESWKRHFKPISIRSALLVKPSWSRCRPRKGQAVVVLDPGLSFGTGQHPTTAFCLRQLVDLRRQGEEQSCLDVGSGSGILAIAAAKLGYRPVNAMDCDADAVRIARANARRNGISSRISFSKQDLTKLSLRGVPEYSVICANLIANLLVAERQRLLSRLRTDGNLVAAGILGTEFEQVQQAFESAGLRLKASRLQGEWRSGVFGGGAEGCERSRDLCR